MPAEGRRLGYGPSGPVKGGPLQALLRVSMQTVHLLAAILMYLITVRFDNALVHDIIT